MDKKLISQVISKNLTLLILSIMASVNFMMQVSNALYTPKGMGELNVNSVVYTLFQLKIDITQGTYNHLYSIHNYVLIPVILGLIYNIYILVKVFKNKDN
ncbi:MAG: hypothetical protein CVU84_15110 [Firmicutes bacterium HGW-Firmicutes-1]|jgi:hypothetical protein|nr:MAG: hypothetical protein CVU84_15110 [Firmicutes bacterium HGW-Firmicutes-1]